MNHFNDNSARAYPDGLPMERQPPWREDFPIDEAADSYVSRREYTKFLVLTSAAFVAGQSWIGLSSLLQKQGPYSPQPIARLADVPIGGVVEFRYPDETEPCLLVRVDSDRLVAYSQKCTHLSCAVIPESSDGRLHCPCHHGYFDMAEGRPIAGPPRRPLPRIALEVREGIIYATGVELRST